MRWGTSRWDLNPGQGDRCKTGGGCSCSTDKDRRAISPEFELRLICVSTHTHIVVHLQRLSRLKNHKGAFWSNISQCFNRVSHLYKKKKPIMTEFPASCRFTDDAIHSRPCFFGGFLGDQMQEACGNHVWPLRLNNNFRPKINSAIFHWHFGLEKPNFQYLNSDRGTR